jgi:hypothetical protein
VTINGASHVLILNTEWSPETTLQAEDRCHRPGQTREVFVHCILSAGTVEEQMWELIDAKAAAQRAVFDKEPLYKSVEQVMAEAVSAQVQVARAVIEVQREDLPEQVQPDEPQPESTEVSPQPASGQLSLTDLYQRYGAQPLRGGRAPTPAAAQQLELPLGGELQPSLGL